jgi:hypothetical protein
MGSGERKGKMHGKGIGLSHSSVAIEYWLEFYLFAFEMSVLSVLFYTPETVAV